MNIYAPNNCKERVQFFEKIEKWMYQYVPNYNEGGDFLGGDFNCVWTSKYDTEGGIRV